MTAAQVLVQRGLLDATTALRGWREDWLSGSQVSDWAVAALVADDGGVDPDLVALTSAERLPPADVQDLLEARAAAETTAEEVAHQRWMLAALLALRDEPLGDEERLDRLDELYADLGYPEELRYISRYNFTPEERATPGVSSAEPTSPLDAADAAISALEAVLLPGGTGGPA